MKVPVSVGTHRVSSAKIADMTLVEQFVADTCDRNDVYAAACPCREMLDVLANKWSALAIGLLENGPLRFGELRRGLQGISPKVLSSTMKKLEDAGLVEREVFAEVPPRVEYSLTPLGASAAGPLAMLRDWVDENVTRH
jgi:DNA-binding HxlR family transcriptional regulator